MTMGVSEHCRLLEVNPHPDTAMEEPTAVSEEGLGL